MEEAELLDKIREIGTRKRFAVEALVAPARAAANQMKDAGMKAGADALNAALFQIDATEDELNALIRKDPAAAMRSLFSSIKGKGDMR